MGVVIRQGVKYTLIAYVGVVIGALTNLFLMPALLSPEQIGGIRQILANATLLSAFVLAGTPQVIERFHPFFEGRRRDALFSLSIAYTLTTFLLLTLLLWGGRSYYLSLYEKSPHVKDYFLYLFPLTLGMAFQSILEAWCRAYLRIAVPALFRDFFLKMTIALLVVAVGVHWMHFGYMFGAVTAYYVIAVLGLTAYLYRLYCFRLFPAGWWDTVRGRLKEMMEYAAFILMGGLSVVVVNQADIVMLGMLLGEADTGIYTIAFFMANVIEIPRRALSQITTPLIARAWAKQAIDELAVLYRQSAINQMLIGGALFLLLWLNREEIFTIMPKGDLYREGMSVVFWVGLARFFDMAMGVNNEILLQSRYYKFVLLSNILLALLVIATNWWLIPLMGLEGAALATFLSMLVYNLLRSFFLWVKVHIHPFSKQTLWATLVLLVLWRGLAFLPLLPVQGLLTALVNILLRSGLLLLLLAAAIWKLRLSEELVHIGGQLLKRLRRRP
ncbi:MATE family efflux transporter [Thermonema rossianum]|uniref:MATE family efflux transporter n=1 Tax=Thermonema rossianum TaxID=55505 RepID=UPI000571480D|nr:oligosaccharide flippase family protein [Thermonema rossianum]